MIRRLLLAAIRPHRPTADQLPVGEVGFDFEFDDEATIAFPPMADLDVGRKRFMLALLLARQVCREDVRRTGVTYLQWWSETFCPQAPSATTLLQTRSDMVLLIDWLIALLPFETDPRLLQVQLSNQPTGRYRAGQKRTGDPTASTVPHDDVVDELHPLVIVPGEELERLDAAYLDTCLQRWSDYKEIGQGRLAELRVSCTALS